MYRIRRYQYKAWVIEQFTGGRWLPYKYPGNITEAARGLVDLQIPTERTFDDLAELITAVNEAADRVVILLGEQGQ